jgi:squalene-associated FAD-dependent desaturase
VDRRAHALARPLSVDTPGHPLRVAVVGGGWAGLSAAVTATAAGHRVTVYEMAPQWGGRARSTAGTGLDNGQHILIGAYQDTLALMRRVGVDPDAVLRRQPLALRWADGRGLQLRGGPAAWAFATAVLRCDAWPLRDQLGLLAACARWALSGFRCTPDRSVADLCAGLSGPVRRLLIDPLCVAALNTPAHEASAAVFLRVLRDGLFGGRGACDLLLPRLPLRDLLPAPAARWLAAHGAELHTGRRVMAIEPAAQGWRVDGQVADAVIVACPAGEAARLLAPLSPGWAATAGALRFEPIVTAYLRAEGARLPMPMLALPDDEQSPAQYVFDHGALGLGNGRYAFVVSGAAPWVERGLDATVAAILAQARRELARWGWPPGAVTVEAVVAERRATFRSTPGLRRPPMAVAHGLMVAGDYVDGPYPATLEGAVRSGVAAAMACASTMQNKQTAAFRPS